MGFEKFAGEFGAILTLEPAEIRALKPETRFRDLPAWDSLALISLIVLLDTAYGVRINRQDLQSLSTLGDVLSFIATAVAKK